MTPENFVYWLQGYFEMTGATTLTEQQVEMIKEHLAMVLIKETSSVISTGIKIEGISDEIKKKIKDEMKDGMRGYFLEKENPFDGPRVMFNDTYPSC